MPEIITQINSDLHTSWQKELANVVTDPQKLLKMLDLDVESYREHFSARKLFPVRVPLPFISRMEKGQIDDPLLAQVMPRSDEFIEQTGYFADPLEEHDTVAEGLLHKYKHRVLMIVKAGCAVNCRYCFRRHFPYQDNSPNKQRWQSALDYIKNHREINEVIFSGGDPLMANDQHLAWLISEIETISHVKRLRIHTRLPVVIPARVTSGLVERLVKSRLKVAVVLHINHSNEIDLALAKAVAKFTDARIPVFNQSTLLKSVNDSAEILSQLSEDLFDIGIQPYYLHIFDKVQGAAHFDLTTEQVRTIIKQTMAILPGFLMPKVVSEIAGEPSKTPFSL
ncbi:EF-P beta-lysylation protein EpmB [Thalassotalea sp. LPB0316]|uniref:EF-P beta-lysylation protein EpmB n=1 Tax=Thalassotalea sp. LPB0316 TaxID=2769490 RepID=UPI0018663E65|nr:EF-P beta-lysylation protein EpmB [Thalassotalea sp. LPB0316]QOL26693.1 EF-P beta-lysylation protein EpmB [Thalassotalea sp. LPB0316]